MGILDVPAPSRAEFDALSHSVGSSSKAPDWAASTAYLANQIIRAPDGTLQRANADHTSGASFNPANWTALGGVNGVQVKKTERIGVQPQALRAPSLTVQGEWPNDRQDIMMLWGQGATAYGVTGDFSLRKTTDGGYSWGRRNTAAIAFQPGYRGMFLKTQAGTLLTMERGGVGATPAPTIRRSTDDGATWSAAVYSMRAGYQVLTAQSWCQDLNTGYLYMGEYTPDDTKTDIKVLRSTDDGATWTEWMTFSGPGSADPNRIRHVHSCQYDPVSQRVYFLTGDSQVAAGIYRVTADGSTVEAVVLNNQLGTKNGLGGNGVPTARCVAAMFFPNAIAWVTDDSNGTFCRMDRSQIGQANPAVTVVHSAMSSGWGTIRAAADASMWLASADSDNGANLSDYAAHLYAVRDDGATVWEIGVAAAGPTGTSYTGFVPLGQAELHTADSIWLARSFGAQQTGGQPAPWQARAVLTRGGGIDLSRRGYAFRRRHVPPATICSGVQALTAGQSLTFFKVTVPTDPMNFFIVIDWAITRVSGTGTSALTVVRMDTSANLFGAQGSTAQFRSTVKVEDDYAASPQIPAGTVIEFRLAETGAVNPVTANAYVTYAFGSWQNQQLLF